ncbi:MAG: hypothetical protein CSA49_04805 [Gammaproteobacteria bacterium]|nr:MAG: hypothetical protein CSA49_04805 [Gammaproteobacteria bacterium]
MEKLPEIIITLIIVAAVAYYLKLDLADVTSRAGETAAKNTKALANQLGYTITSPRSASRQDAMTKQYKGYQITIDGDHSQIEIDFQRSLGLRLFSSENQFGEVPKLHVFNFSNSKLDKFFVYKVANKKMLNQQKALQEALLPLIDHFDNRRLKYLYIKDEYLRIGFAYRNYLPIDFIRQSLPPVEQAAEALKAIQNNRQR